MPTTTHPLLLLGVSTIYYELGLAPSPTETHHDQSFQISLLLVLMSYTTYPVSLAIVELRFSCHFGERKNSIRCWFVRGGVARLTYHNNSTVAT